jgi:hypothetical protein
MNIRILTINEISLTSNTPSPDKLQTYKHSVYFSPCAIFVSDLEDVV